MKILLFWTLGSLGVAGAMVMLNLWVWIFTGHSADPSGPVGVIAVVALTSAILSMPVAFYNLRRS